VWVQALRPLSFTASIVPVLLGAAVAGTQSLFNPGLLLLTLVAAVALQGALGVLGTYVYSGRLIAYPYRALGDLVIFLLFGPLLALGAYYVQAQALELIPAIYALPIGCLATAILHVNTRAIPFDERGIASTVVPALGLRGSKVPPYGMLIAAYILVVSGVLTGAFVRGSALALLSAPIAWTLLHQRLRAVEPHDLALLGGAAARLHLVFGLLLIVGVLL